MYCPRISLLIKRLLYGRNRILADVLGVQHEGNKPPLLQYKQIGFHKSQKNCGSTLLIHLVSERLVRRQLRAFSSILSWLLPFLGTY